MSSTALFLVLIGIIVCLNSVALIALTRQVGLLHLRVKPLRAVRDEDGPATGTRLVLDPEQWSFEDVPTDVQRIVFAFVSPTCSLCSPLIPGLRRLVRDLDQNEMLCAVTDVSRKRSVEYFSECDLRVPFVGAENSFRQNRIPGAPYIVIADRGGAVASGGGVNTLEQVELLIEDARRADARPLEVVMSTPDGIEANQT